MFTATTRCTGVTSHAGVLVATLVLLSGAAILRGGAATADSNEDDQFLALLAQEGIPALEGVPSLVDRSGSCRRGHPAEPAAASGATTAVGAPGTTPAHRGTASAATGAAATTVAVSSWGRPAAGGRTRQWRR